MNKLWMMTILITVFLSRQGFTTFVDLTDPVPVNRLIENLSTYVKSHPDDAHGHYLLGRAHSLAFAKQDTINVQLYEDYEKTIRKTVPRFAPWDSLLEAKVENGSISDSQKNHLLLSIKHYQTATELNPTRGLYFLGLGWMMEQALPFNNEIGLPPLQSQSDEIFDLLYDRLIGDPETINFEYWLNNYQHSHFHTYKQAWKTIDDQQKQALSAFIPNIWEQECLRFYRSAFTIGIARDLSVEYRNLNNRDNQIGIEAGQGIIRVLGSKSNQPKYAWEVEAITKAIKIAKEKGGFITPIILSLQPSKSIDELLSPHTYVQFMMDGFSNETYWSWVKPNTCILVWDPEQRGKITSGKQLFGSVTWWLFWENGYQAMSMLDDNLDGYLSGHELRGLALWADANQNGISDLGEVTPIEQTIIQKLSTQPEANHGKTIYSLRGIQLKDGTWLPTYDWFPDQFSNE